MILLNCFEQYFLSIDEISDIIIVIKDNMH